MEKINRNLNLIYTIIILRLKSIKEYKTNLYLGLLAHASFMVIISFIYIVLTNNFSDVIYWELKEFIFFLLFLETFLFLSESTFKYLRNDLINGNLNNFLTKPINTFIYQGFVYIEVIMLIFAVTYLLLFFVYFSYYTFLPIKFLITFIFACFGGFLLVTFRILFNNIAFFMKESNFLNKIYFGNFMNIFSVYPPTFFKNTKVYYFSYIVVILYYAALPTDYYFGYINFKTLLYHFYILIFLIISFNVISYFLWKIGIKKYEAFG